MGERAWLVRGASARSVFSTALVWVLSEAGGCAAAVPILPRGEWLIGRAVKTHSCLSTGERLISLAACSVHLPGCWVLGCC